MQLGRVTSEPYTATLGRGPGPVPPRQSGPFEQYQRQNVVPRAPRAIRMPISRVRCRTHRPSRRRRRCAKYEHDESEDVDDSRQNLLRLEIGPLPPAIVRTSQADSDTPSDIAAFLMMSATAAGRSSRVPAARADRRGPARWTDTPRPGSSRMESCSGGLYHADDLDGLFPIGPGPKNVMCLPIGSVRASTAGPRFR